MEEISREEFVRGDSHNIVGSVQPRTGSGHGWCVVLGLSSEIVGGIEAEDIVTEAAVDGIVVVEVAAERSVVEAAAVWEALVEGACSGMRKGSVGSPMP